jgi:hypothetical protein
MLKLLPRAAVLVIPLMVFSLSNAIVGQTAAPADAQVAARQLLASPAAQFMTPQALMALAATANGSRRLGEDASVGQRAASQAAPRQGGLAPSLLAPAGLANVRVNDPAEDIHQPDQTTQSETSIAAVGDRIAVGFNDSQTTLLALTAGSSISGYGYSTDGGASFTDGGALPNPAGCINFGDPWLAADRAGSMYYSNLVDCATGLFVGVAKSTDGGRTFSPPTIITPQTNSPFYFADKDALTAGRDPLARSHDNLYDTWDDFTFSAAAGVTLAGLAVARSTDGGAHWQVAHANQVPVSAPCPGNPNAFSFTQYIGAQPLVDPRTGALYVAAEKLSASCPSSPTAPPNPVMPSEVIFVSTDGGTTFGPEVKVADVTFSFPQGVLQLAPGRLMRNGEFPTLAQLGRFLYLAWNDGGSGQSHILVSRSSDGTTWSPPTSVTVGSGDEMQPALSSDGSSLQVLYYQRNSNNTLDVLVASSTDGSTFAARRVTTQSFAGALTLPQADPIIAPAYMGDYIDSVSVGGHRYYAWGDNRDTETNFLYPQGRPDPNVYFARQ